MILTPDIAIVIFRQAGGGAPDTIMLWPQTATIMRGIVGYEQTIANNFGFETMRADVVCDIESALPWLDDLGVGAIVYSPDGTVIWEGHLFAVDIQFGQERASASLDRMFNYVTCRYTTYLGTQAATSPLSDTDSIALYGRKELIFSVGTTDSTGAAAAATRKLAETKNPRAPASSEVGAGAPGEVRLSLTFEGWAGGLGWITTSSTTTTTASASAQVGSLLTAFAAINPFVATTTANFDSSGATVSQFIPPDTTYRTRIDQLWGFGGSGVRLVWGVYEAREMYVNAWAGSVPTTVHYRRSAGESVVRNSVGGVVPWWELRPNRMYERTDMLDVGAVSTQADTAGRFAIERVTCRVDQSGVSVSLEGTDAGNADAFIARMSQ